MPKYSMLVEGRNFPARSFQDAEGPVGFYALRFVEATDAKEAELAVVELIKAEYRSMLKTKLRDEVMPTLHLDQLKELDEFPEDHANTGATWFPMES